MAIQASGAVSFSDLRSEFIGGSGAVSFSSLYRGGSYIRNNAANNPTTNLAASVPTSGVIDISNFYSQQNGFRKIYTAGATNQNGNVIFGDDWGVNVPKEIIINSGVELGATSTDDWALEMNAGGAGAITVTNNGTLTGKGGAINGGAGGDAMRVNCAGVTIINNGTIRGGGGGGGKGGNGGNGGTGGQGQTTSCSFYGCNCGCSGTPGAPCGAYPGSCSSCGGCCMGESFCYQYSTQTTNYYNGGAGGSGGSGGNGGLGQGYGQAFAAGGVGGGTGANGSAGGTNAGAGGSGGNGGDGGSGGGYGSAGSNGNSGLNGNSGANGNYTNGSAGSAGAGGASGGAAGRAVQRDVAYTLSVTGTMQGAYN